METRVKTKPPEYSSWRGMKDRCYNPNTPYYNRYGGRGIKVCDRWKDSFDNFLEDMGPRPNPDMSIDRYPDNDGNYEPGNCRWATNEQQMYNRSVTTKIPIASGKTLNSKEAMEHFGLSKGTLFSRLYKDRPLDDPIREMNQDYVWRGKCYKLAELATIANLPNKIVSSRLTSGWSVEHAVTTPLQEDPVYLHNGEYLTVKEICTLENVKDFNLRHHLNRKLSVKDAIATMRTVDKKYPYEGKVLGPLQIANLANVAYSTLIVHLRNGESVEDALINIAKNTELRKVDYLGERMTIQQVSDLTGVSKRVLHKYSSRGVPMEQALVTIRNNTERLPHLQKNNLNRTVFNLD